MKIEFLSGNSESVMVFFPTPLCDNKMNLKASWQWLGLFFLNYDTEKLPELIIWALMAIQNLVHLSP